MEKFSEFKYKRPDLEAIQSQFGGLLKEFNEAESFETRNAVIAKINALRYEIGTMSQICQIRNDVDTTNEFYENE